MVAFIGGVGHWEVLVVLVVALLLFGSRLPSVMRSLGKSVSSFKQGLREVEDDLDTAGGPDTPALPSEKPRHPAG
ncbi:MAG: twin-arginine translocase TatA/TatE family subunit [Candidatus Brocadiaceae bacterium]|nr:twin-arginine translocase TatA/TatE family subunit [Candidatus Brocadiaceae bacterium]